MLNRLSLNRIGLNRIGLNRIGKPSGGSSDRPYIDPKVLDSLCGVWIMDQNTNESESRNIIKNTIKNKGGDLELLNFGYKLNSGYGLYEHDFTTWISSPFIDVVNKTNELFHVTNNTDTKRFALSYNLTPGSSDLKGYKIKIEIIKGTGGEYKYYNEEGKIKYFTLNESKIYTLPASHNSILTTYEFNAFLVNPNSSYRITQIPSHQGALVTDGINDLITSTKTVQEMLGGSKEITVVSMIHQIGRLATNTNLFTNCIWANTGSKGCNIVNYQTSLGKTGIYGYSRANVSVANNEVVINNILGDKADYLTNVSIGALTSNEKFSVVGYLDVSPQQVTSVAVYWTFIANKVLTTDEINQIIAYFKLDKYVTPQVIYDVKRQGLTNDTPAADWYLKDFSGNGYDMQLYNFAKKLGSGISKYEEDFTSWLIGTNINVTNDTIKAVGIVSSYVLTKVTPNSEIAPFTIKVTGIPKNGEIRYYYCSSSTKIDSFYIREDGQYNVPQSERWELTGSYRVGFTISNPSLDWSRLVIEQIPDYEGALVSDGKDDYGQFVGDLGLKDYTIAVDRAYVEGLGGQVPIISSIGTTVNTPFLMEHMGVGKILAPHSFGTYTALSTLNTDRFISYQSTYKYNGDNLTKGTSTDTGSGLTIDRFGANNSQYAKLALWSFLLFPYSLSEFLLERQLKRYKLGTLYPDMVEVRPIVKSNTSNYLRIEYRNGKGELIQPGSYLPVGSILRISVVMKDDTSEVSSLKVDGVDIPETNYSNGRFYIYDATVTKSPQKIDITIDEYVRYEDIVQPYPVLLRFKDENGNEVSWGGKFRVGSDIVFVGSANLLPELYTVSETRYNGVTLYPNTIIKVEKSMVFDNARTYLKANEPSCILSPNRLRIPNSSYKILGYIPDLTGKGNHGRLNNFAYAGMSGANGYKYDYETFLVDKVLARIDDYKRVTYFAAKNSVGFFDINSASYKGRIKLTGVKKAIDDKFIDVFRIYTNSPTNNEAIDIYEDGIYDVDIKGANDATRLFFFALTNSELLSTLNTPIVIEQIGKYEGSFCLDGVDDHITISNIIGGKCIMAKVTVNRNSGIIYDQRRANVPNKSWMQLNPSSVIFEQNAVSTYIDGILNHNVTGSDLVSKTVNLTCELEIGDTSGTYQPTIGSSYAVGYTTDINLYEFMLFPEIPSEDEIKKLNNVMGIEGGYVESPDYYWDAYGKKNTDTDRNLIADQVSKDVANALEVKNVAYNSESGYSQIVDTVLFKNWLDYGAPSYIEYILINDTTINITKSNRVDIDAFYCRANVKKKSYYKITGLQEGQGIQFGYTNNIIYTAESDGVHEIDWSLVPENYQELSTTFVGDCNITIEQVAQYPNGLVSDGVEDHLINTTMPILTDYTWIVKRKWLDLVTYQTFAHKGVDITNNGAFLFEYIESGFYTRSFSNIGESKEFPELISYQTKNNYNGTSLTPGSISDGNWLRIFMGSDQYPRYTKAVFYKAMLYTKTIDQLSINMLKNLFEIDELINVTNPIFKKQ